MPTEVQKAAALRVASRVSKAILQQTTLGFEQAPFAGHFSKRVTQELVNCGIDAPERLLFMFPDDIKNIPGIGKAGLAEIMAYRARFLPT